MQSYPREQTYAVRPSREADLNGCKFQGVSFRGCDLSQSSFAEASFRETCFDDARLDEATFRAANLSGCSLKRSSLRGTSFESAVLDFANFEGATWTEALVSNTSFNQTRGLSTCRRLETVRTGASKPRYFDTAIVPFAERSMSWHRLRVVGRLPLFGVSYSALVLLPFLFYLLETFDGRISQIRAAASSIPLESAGGRLAAALVAHLHTEPVPRLSFVLFLCTIVLAIGATIYAALCPARIKEFSKDQWEDQLDRPIILYLPLSWKHRLARIACATCYAIGGGGVLFVLLTKIIGALVYLANAKVG